VGLERFVVDVVLQRLLARGEGGGDLLARGVVGGGGELALQLGLHRPAKGFEREKACENKEGHCTRPGSWEQKVWKNSPLALEDELRAGVAPGSELGGLQGDRSLGKISHWTRQERQC